MQKIIIVLIMLGLFFILFPINITSASENPLESNVVAYWALDSDSGNIVIDSSSNHYNGVCYNMENEDWVSGKLNNCLVFDGVNEYLDCGNIADFERNQAFSLEMWIKYGILANMLVMGKVAGSSANIGYYIGIINGKVYVYIRHDTANGLHAITLDTYNDNIFHHCVITYDGSSNANNIRIYIDSIEQNKQTLHNNLCDTISNVAHFRIGSYDSPNSFFNGYLDEVVIYNKELTQSDVDFRYNGGVGREYYINFSPNKPICISPIDRRLNINIDTTLKVEVVDMDNDTMNVSFYLDDTFIEKFSNISNNTILESSNLSLDYSKMYAWYAVVEDKYNLIQSDIFMFATKSEPESIIPNVSPEKPILISPDNNSINLSKFIRLETHVDDIDDDFLYVSFYWENNSEIQSLFSITNYTIQTSTLNLEYNTTYGWYVVVTDFVDYNISDIYTFTTESEPVEDEDEDDISPPTTIELDYSILLIGICLAILVFALEFYSNRLKIKRSNLLSAIELALLLIIISIMIFLKVS